MKSRLLIAGVCVGAALLLASPGAAGGPFEQVVGVGARGSSRTILLRPTGPRSESVLTGTQVALPKGGFVRLYPMIGGLPGDPGRYYPTAGVACFYWAEPASNCMRLREAGVDLLGPLAKLPLRHEAPTLAVGVDYRARPLRYGRANVAVALELALERLPVAQLLRPRRAIRLALRWKGPNASRQPTVVWLAPRGVYAEHRLFRLPRGTWSYVAANLPHD